MKRFAVIIYKYTHAYDAMSLKSIMDLHLQVLTTVSKLISIK